MKMVIRSVALGLIVGIHAVALGLSVFQIIMLCIGITAFLHTFDLYTAE